MEYRKISELTKLPENPRIITDKDFKTLVASVKKNKKFFEARPCILSNRTGELVIIGGNQRYSAALHLGWEEVPTYLIEDLTEDQEREIIIRDNVSNGKFDWDIIANNWEVADLEEWGLDLPLDWGVDKTAEASAKLQEKFIIPPFSILDTRQGYWQDRKRYWKELIGDNGESRKEALGSGGLTISEKSTSWLHNPKLGNGVSLLDPVLAELVNRWFGLEKCNTFDCFAGDSVFGYVSDALGNTFTGIELRQEQTDLNNKRLKGSKSKYICDDGQNVLKHIKENSQDLLFSCPPYFDLEVYSDLQNDASNQKEYSDFLQILGNAFTDAIKCLKDNRFAVITVGDIRNKQGFYYGFVDDIKAIFKINGMGLYNELILVEPIAFGAIRAGGNMIARKITKCHQNVLVFFKGDPKEIKNIYPKLDFSNIEDESTDF